MLSRIRKPWEYQRVYEKGKRIRGENFTLIIQPNGTDRNRLGISIHGIDGAVKRNRIKRVIREVFRLHGTLPGLPGPAQSMSAGIDTIFAARRGFNAASMGEVKKTVESAVTRWLRSKGESCACRGMR